MMGIPDYADQLEHAAGMGWHAFDARGFVDNGIRPEEDEDEQDDSEEEE